MTVRRDEPAADQTGSGSDVVAQDGSAGKQRAAAAASAHGSRRHARTSASRAPANGAEATEAARLSRESEDRFRTLVEATGQLVWTTPPDGLVVDMPLWRAYTGQTAEQVGGWGWLDAVHPEDRERVRAAWIEAIARPTLYEVEYRLRRQDGVYRYFLVRAVPRRALDGTLREWIGVHTDLTERRALEEAMRQKAQEVAARAAELEATFDAMADGVLMYDAEGRLIRANSRARAMLSRYSDPDEQMLRAGERSHRLVLYNAQGNPLPPDGWPIRRVLRGETLTADNGVDVKVRAHDGSEILLSITGEPLFDAEGGILGAVLGLRDVTERRGVEERTRAALDALLLMAETLVLGSEGADRFSLDALSGAANPAAQRIAVLTQRVIGCRRLSISIVEPETAMLRPIALVGLPLEREREWWETEGQGAPLRQQVQPEVLARLEAGELVVIDVHEPPYDSLPNPYGVIVVVMAPMRIGNRLMGLLACDYAGVEHIYTEDELALIGAVARLGALVIERNRLLREREESRANELALRETTRRFDEFLSIASHELRTPLTSIRANAQLASRRLAVLDGDETGQLAPVRALLARADRQTAVLSRLVDDLLDVSRIQANKLEFRFEPCDLGAVAREAVQEQRLTWPDRPIALDVPDAPVQLVADPDRVGQVVTNFLTNALKYSEEEQPVAVRLTVDGAMARVSVRDEGPGLPPEERELIWERFHRAEGVRVLAGSGVGLGLGLYISRTIVERHGGRVGVKSVVGMGSTFWFEIPAGG